MTSPYYQFKKRAIIMNYSRINARRLTKDYDDINNPTKSCIRVSLESLLGDGGQS